MRHEVWCRASGSCPSEPIHLVGRYYDPATGEFVNVDPLVDQTGQPYGYTGDDPVNVIGVRHDLGFVDWTCLLLSTPLGGLSTESV